MTGRADRQLRPSSEGRVRRWIPFWVVQALEIGVGVVFVDVSIHVHNAGLLVGAALAFFALAVTAQGPVGLVRICSQPVHLALVMGVSVLVALGPLLPALRPDIEGIIVLEFGAVGLFRVCMLTRTTSSSGPIVAGGGPGPTVIDATARVAEAAASTTTGAPGARPSPPTAPSSYDAAARWVGRTTGAASSVGKQTAAKYGPTARARVKKTIRSAGRLTGSVVSPSTDDPADPEGA
jgi:hypothetical protein